jgi:2-oxoglutarate dehydrogenase complex dehydrogenase (E1) component-like enzyme
MAEQTVDPNVFETANAGFAQAIYEEYLKDPAQVAPEWRSLFESGRIGEQPPARPDPASAGNGRAATARDRRRPSRRPPPRRWR